MQVALKARHLRGRSTYASNPALGTLSPGTHSMLAQSTTETFWMAMKSNNSNLKYLSVTCYIPGTALST